VAYDDDHGRVLDANGAMLWATANHVMQTFSFGANWTCGIEQYSGLLYASQHPLHVVTVADVQNTSRKTISVDCRYDTVCSLYASDNSSSRAMFFNATDQQSGSVVACLGDAEWYLPWNALAIARGHGHACAIVQDAAQQQLQQDKGVNAVYCWGSTVWGNAPVKVDNKYTLFTLDARKIITGARTTCAIDKAPASDEYGDVHCWGYSLGFYGRYDTNARVVRFPVQVSLPADTHARDMVVVDIARDENSDQNGRTDKSLEVVVCMLLDNYMLVCRGNVANPFIKDAWRLAPYHETFPTRVALGPRNGELCVVYNYYDDICWDVRLAPPFLGKTDGAFQEREPLATSGTLLQMMQPTLWYANPRYEPSEATGEFPSLTRAELGQHSEELPLLLKASAFVFPAKLGGVCLFNIPYCLDSKFGPPTEMNPALQPYPSSQRWMYLINMASPEEGDALLYLPSYDKTIWFHTRETENNDPVPFLTFATSFKMWITGSDRVRAKLNEYVTDRRDPFDTDLMFVAVRTQFDDILQISYTDISVRIADVAIESTVEKQAGVTFRVHGFQEDTSLPAIDNTNPRLVWVALQTGADRSRVMGDTVTWDKDSRHLWDPEFQEADGQSAQVLSMINPKIIVDQNHVTVSHVGVCARDFYDKNDPYNCADSDTNCGSAEPDCTSCLDEQVKPLAHMTSCVGNQYQAVELSLRRGFDGSLRMGSKAVSQGLTTVVSQCSAATVINPYVIDDAGNPSCTDCLSLPCKPWETTRGNDDELLPCNKATGSRQCNPLAWPNCEAGERHGSDTRCVAAQHVTVDKRAMPYDATTGRYNRTYTVVKLVMDVVPIEEKKVLLAYAKPRQRPAGSQYDIVSFGQGPELLVWKTSINPTCTLGLFWYDGTEAIDVCMGSLCIRYEKESISVSVLSDASSTESPRVQLATVNIRGNSFTRNRVERHASAFQQAFIPPYYVTNVTIEIRTHKRPRFALSHDIEEESVSIWTMGKALDLAMPYQEMYSHMARTAYPGSTPHFPYMYVAMQRPKAIGLDVEDKIRYEERFVSVSHLKLGTPVPSSAAATDEAYQSTVFIAACLQSFMRCRELKETIFPGAAPYTNKEAGAQGTARRRLLESGGDTAAPDSGDFDANGAATFVTLDDVGFHLQSDPDEATEVYHDFRLSLRMRLSNASGVVYGNGLVLSNKLAASEAGGSSSGSSSGPPHDMRVEVVSGEHVRLHLCGVEHVTDALVPGEWNEFSFVVKTQSVLTLLHNNEPMVVQHFLFGDSSTGDPCYVDNTKITVGHSQGEDSALGVDLQFAILNEDILVNDPSMFLDGVLVTDVQSLPPDSPPPVWTADVLEQVRARLSKNVKHEFNYAPVATYVSLLDDGNVEFSLRIYANTDSLLNFKLRTFIQRLNTEFITYRIPPVTLRGGGESLAEDVVPSLGLTYRTIPSLICGTFNAVCVYDGLALGAHSVSVDKRTVKAAAPLDVTATAPFNFHALDEFSVGPDTLRSHVSAPGGVDAVQRYWGSGYDCSLDFFLRTKSDKNEQLLVDLAITYPTTDGQGMSIVFRKYWEDHTMIAATVEFGGRRTVLFATYLTASTGFQHIRVALDVHADFRMWVDGVQAHNEKLPAGDTTHITYHPFFDPDIARGVDFSSTPLPFLDGVREISSIHFASNRLDSCTCQSECAKHNYADTQGEGGCSACPQHTMTLEAYATSLDQCVCVSEFSRDDPADAFSCTYDPPVVYTYNAPQDKRRKHCMPAPGLNQQGECASVDLLGDDQLDCSCLDSCLTALPGDRLCCRNKCTVCPGSSSLCDCVWDAENQIAFNNASGTGGALCSGYMCAVGERVQAGRCVPCETNSYQDEVKGKAECSPCLACDPGFFRVGCGLGQQGACKRCTECEAPLIATGACGGISDTVCGDPGTCEALARDANCMEGEYYAGCDTSVLQSGRCEKCPVEEATDCPSGFFLDFKCLAGLDTPIVPNQCLPCNRARCPGSDLLFPSPGVCGNKDTGKEHTMMEATMECTQMCNTPQDDEWLQKLCQWKRPVNATTYATNA
jgi:hypothetical protein